MKITVFSTISEAIDGAGPCDIMALAAHPDDIEFGAAGTITRWLREGKTAAYVLATDGDKGTGDRSLEPEQLRRVRRQEQARAADIAGANQLVFMGYPDQGLEDTADFRKEIVRLIRLFRPSILLTSDPYRRYVWHRDHRILGQVAMDAVFPYARDHLAYPDLLAEGLEPHKVQEIFFWGAEEINYRVDISRTFSVKAEALGCHASQLPGFATKDPFARMRRRCQKIAENEQYELAEGFHRIKLPR